ncbi:MAG: outer membrane lipoprotein-sorting protein [Bdellovibrionota bacterium]
MKLIYLLVFLAVPNLQAATNADLLLKKADDIRNPAQSYAMTVQVDDDGNQTEFEVFIKDQDKTIIVTKAPARDRGRNMLMLDRDFQAFIPNLKRSMRLSLAQKLSGQVANGDISRTRWHGDYSVTLEKETPQEAQLLLKANKENLTYAWIRLWIDKKTNRPLRTEYLGLNGKTLLKKAYFENYKEMAGDTRPSVIRIEDTNKKSSQVKIISMTPKKIEDSFFTVRNMESLK